ncbi:hypothetical protein [Novosphingobium beihaiensis]|uniref:Uncharacterized protein n=1 Tax=Novosphingobium beihaiensis TaxID=2930389 RepID=A0ABT0BMF4_9SPHN|nr:hypothetical protein [Novosphingobium beihaiensis]MCJ2186232.1 hypothetical protein [Novosphingobium beihaiensis]
MLGEFAGDVVAAVTDGWGAIALCILVVALLAPKMTEGLHPNPRAAIFLVLFFSFLAALWLTFSGDKNKKPDNQTSNDVSDDASNSAEVTGKAAPENDRRKQQEESGPTPETEGISTPSISTESNITPMTGSDDFKISVKKEFRAFSYNDELSDVENIRDFFKKLGVSRFDGPNVIGGICGTFKNGIKICGWANTYDKPGVFGFRFGNEGNWNFIGSNRSYFEESHPSLFQ